MTKENILKELYNIEKGIIDVKHLINVLECDLLDKPVKRLKKDRLIGIKHILEIGRKNGISSAWLQGFKIDGKTVITNGYTVVALNDGLPYQEYNDDRDKAAQLEKIIRDVHRCDTFGNDDARADYKELRNLYTVGKARGNKRPMYYIDLCQRQWNIQYLLDAMRLFNNPVLYGYNPDKTYVVIAEDGDTNLNEFALVMGTSATYKPYE